MQRAITQKVVYRVALFTKKIKNTGNHLANWQSIRDLLKEGKNLLKNEFSGSLKMFPQKKYGSTSLTKQEQHLSYHNFNFYVVLSQFGI